MLAAMQLLCLNNAINRANIYTLWLVEVTFTLNALVGIDLEKNIAFENSLGGANGLACSARNAVI
jgi:hypothetical protein